MKAILAIALLASGCHIGGSSSAKEAPFETICVAGVNYLKFSTGVTVQLDQRGQVVRCPGANGVVANQLPLQGADDDSNIKAFAARSGLSYEAAKATMIRQGYHPGVQQPTVQVQKGAPAMGARERESLRQAILSAPRHPPAPGP